jgi:dipeptidyl aminopeptidase/acylaminoacyl peptidase
MKKYLLVAFIFSLFPLKSHGQSNGETIARTPITFPPYAEVKDISWYYEKGSYEDAVKDKSVTYEKLTYHSDGLKVIAFLISPAQKTNQKLPVIIFNRGSFIRNDIAYVHAPLFQKLVHAGFIVIAPALRQSEGGEGKDELGGEDLHDIMNIWPLLEKLQSADRKNVFMLGESRGGMMTYMVLKNGFQVNAAATIGAITDLEAYIAARPWDENNLKNLWSDYDRQKKVILQNRSVMAWYDSIHTPVLILHGAKDPQVKPQHALQLAQAFSNIGKSYELHIFSEGNHILSGPVTEARDAMVVGWFRKFMVK